MADEATTLDEGVSVGGEESLASALGEWAQDGARPPVEHPEA